MIRSLGGIVLVACVAASIGCGEVKSSPVADAPAGADAPGIDAAPDAPAVTAKYDVAYLQEFTVGWASASGGFFGFLLVVNNGPDTLSLDKIRVVESSVDNPRVRSMLSMTATAPALLVGPGRAVGQLSTDASPILRALVPEPFADLNGEELFAELLLEGVDETMVASDLRARTILRLNDDAEIALEFLIHIDAQSTARGMNGVRKPVLPIAP